MKCTSKSLYWSFQNVHVHEDSKYVANPCGPARPRTQSAGRLAWQIRTSQFVNARNIYIYRPLIYIVYFYVMHQNTCIDSISTCLSSGRPWSGTLMLSKVAFCLAMFTLHPWDGSINSTIPRSSTPWHEFVSCLYTLQINKSPLGVLTLKNSSHLSRN